MFAQPYKIGTTKRIVVLLKFSLTGLCVSALLVSTSVLADHQALADDGREVILKENGSWEFKTNDRLATSEDGTRVRLKGDGQWEFIGNAPVQTEQQVRTESLDIALDKIVTEFTKDKVNSKSSRYNAQTIFYLAVDVSSYGEQVTPSFADTSLIVAKDNKGTEYPILRIDSDNKSWQPGTEQRIAIRVDGSPSSSIMWGSTKITLTIDKSVFGTQSNLSFTERTNEIKKKKVAELSKSS